MTWAERAATDVSLQLWRDAEVARAVVDLAATRAENERLRGQLSACEDERRRLKAKEKK